MSGWSHSSPHDRMNCFASSSRCVSGLSVMAGGGGAAFAWVGGGLSVEVGRGAGAGVEVAAVLLAIS